MSDHLQDEETRMMMKTTIRKKEMFKIACGVLNIKPYEFWDTAMKQAVLNSLHVLETEKGKIFDVDDARKELNVIWSTGLSGGSFSADALD